MANYTVSLLAEEEKALLTDMISIQDWLDNAIHNKARQCLDTVVEQVSDKQPKKLTVGEKLLIVSKAVVKSAAERQAEMEGKLKSI